MRLGSLGLGIALALGACSPPAPHRPDAALAADIAPGQAARPWLTFFDADAFDSDLSDILATKPVEMTVGFAAPTSLNALPHRMNVWLTEIEKSSGHVLVEATPPDTARHTRGLGSTLIFGVIDAAMTWQERRDRSRLLANVHAYDATILYDKNTGAAKSIVFRRRMP